MKTSINFANSDAEKAKLFMTQEEIDKAKVVGILKQYRSFLTQSNYGRWIFSAEEKVSWKTVK